MFICLTVMAKPLAPLVSQQKPKHSEFVLLLNSPTTERKQHVISSFWTDLFLPSLISPSISLQKGRDFRPSGKYDGAVDDYSNKGFCGVFWTVEKTPGEPCEVPRCLHWRGVRSHCLMYNLSCILHLLQYASLFFIARGWILSGQTLVYRHKCTHTHVLPVGSGFFFLIFKIFYF